MHIGSVCDTRQLSLTEVKSEQLLKSKESLQIFDSGRILQYESTGSLQ